MPTVPIATLRYRSGRAIAAVASYTRADDFIDVPTRRQLNVVVRLTKRLRRVDGRWRFAAPR